MLNINNINRELVNTLENEIKPADNHSFEWNPKDFPSGVYFVRLNTE